MACWDSMSWIVVSRCHDGYLTETWHRSYSEFLTCPFYGLSIGKSLYFPLLEKANPCLFELIWHKNLIKYRQVCFLHFFFFWIQAGSNSISWLHRTYWQIWQYRLNRKLDNLLHLTDSNVTNKLSQTTGLIWSDLQGCCILLLIG